MLCSILSFKSRGLWSDLAAVKCISPALGKASLQSGFASALSSRCLMLPIPILLLLQVKAGPVYPTQLAQMH